MRILALFFRVSFQAASYKKQNLERLQAACQIKKNPYHFYKMTFREVVLVLMSLSTSSLGHRLAATISSNATNASDVAAHLSSAKRITSASDDAAGASIASRLTTEVKGMSVALRNASEASRLLATADGGIAESLKMLQRIRELAVQSINGTNGTANRLALDQEARGLEAGYQENVRNLKHNTLHLIDGSFERKSIQLGTRSSQVMDISIGDISLKSESRYRLGTEALVSVGGTDTSIGAGTMSIEVGASTITTSVTAGMSAGDVAAALAPDLEGFDVRAQTRLELSEVSGAGQYSFKLNGTAVSANITNTNDLSGLRGAINALSDSTGITAEDAGTGRLVLFSEAGEDIGITNFEASTQGASIRMASLGLDGEPTGTTENVNWHRLEAGYTNTSVNTEVTLSGFSFLANVSLQINGLSVGPVLITDPTNTTILRTAINAISGLTGVQALAGGAAGEITLSSTAATGAVNVAILGGGITQSTQTTTTTTQVTPPSSLFATGQIEISGDEDLLLDHSLSGGGTGFVPGPRGSEVSETEGGIDLRNAESAARTIEYLDANIERITGIRAAVGAYQNRLDHAMESITRTHLNVTKSLATIEDADIAQLSTASAKHRLLYKAATGILANLQAFDRGLLKDMLA